MSATISEPWLSVIMPSYCGHHWIDSSLSSIAAERATGIEVIFVDGSPTSESIDMAKRFTGQLDMHIFHRPDLASWHAKSNFGVEKARSSHVCWLGVDDIWLPGRVKAARRWIEGSRDAMLHLSPSVIMDENGRRLGVWQCPLPTERPLPAEFILERLLVQNFIAAPAPVFRRDAWLRCGGLDDTLWYTADWDLWLKLAAAGPVYYHECTTIGFRIHKHSLTVTGSKDQASFKNQMETVLERHLPRLAARQNLIGPVARASLQVNCALAAASSGDYTQIFKTVSELVRLGPRGLHKYFRDSRIFERTAPRIQARLAGHF